MQTLFSILAFLLDIGRCISMLIFFNWEGSHLYVPLRTIISLSKVGTQRSLRKSTVPPFGDPRLSINSLCFLIIYFPLFVWFVLFVFFVLALFLLLSFTVLKFISLIDVFRLNNNDKFLKYVFHIVLIILGIINFERSMQHAKYFLMKSINLKHFRALSFMQC